MEFLFFAQAVLSIWGASSLFRAFATRYAQGSPEIDRSAAPGGLIRNAEQ